MTIHIHHHHSGTDPETKKILKQILKNLKIIMTREEQLQAILTDINESTNNIATDLENIKNDLANGTVTDATIQQLQSAADTLRSVAASTPDAPAADQQ